MRCDAPWSALGRRPTWQVWGHPAEEMAHRRGLRVALDRSCACMASWRGHCGLCVAGRCPEWRVVRRGIALLARQVGSLAEAGEHAVWTCMVNAWRLQQCMRRHRTAACGLLLQQSAVAVGLPHRASIKASAAHLTTRSHPHKPPIFRLHGHPLRTTRPHQHAAVTTCTQRAPPQHPWPGLLFIPCRHANAAAVISLISAKPAASSGAAVTATIVSCRVAASRAAAPRLRFTTAVVALQRTAVQLLARQFINISWRDLGPSQPGVRVTSQIPHDALGQPQRREGPPQAGCWDQHSCFGRNSKPYPTYVRQAVHRTSVHGVQLGHRVQCMRCGTVEAMRKRVRGTCHRRATTCVAANIGPWRTRVDRRTGIMSRDLDQGSPCPCAAVWARR